MGCYRPTIIEIFEPCDNELDGKKITKMVSDYNLNFFNAALTERGKVFNVKYKDRHINSVLSDIVQVPCGECVGCALDQARQWMYRLVMEDYTNRVERGYNGYFITLTYNDIFVPKNGQLSRNDAFNLIKDIKNFSEYRGYKIRYYLAGEYGSKAGRPHFHLIIWNVPP